METGLNSKEFLAILLERYDQQAAQFGASFERYLELLIETNAVMNLTAITEPDQIREKHFLDCLAIASLLNEGDHLCDVGSGAGFPGIVLAIVHPNCQFDLVEPTTKRTNFLSKVVSELGLKNVTIINQRIEDCNDLKEKYDVVTARAVAHLSVLLELCSPFAKKTGRIIAMKGPSAHTELEEAKHALQALKLEAPILHEITLPNAGQRINFVFEKKQATPPLYPRPYRLIKKTPL